MTWIKLDDAYPEHRKLKRAGDLRALCMALDVAGMCFCARFNTDGFIADEDLDLVLEILPTRKRRQTLVKLTSIGRWSRDDEHGGYWVRDYLKYNPSAAKREEIAAAGRQRAKASRERRSPERAANDERTHSEATPNELRRHSEGAVTPSPSPLNPTDVVPPFTGVGDMPADNDQPSRQKGREGKAPRQSRPPRTPRHPSDEFVIQRARQIRAESGPDAAQAYLRAVSERYGEMSRDEQLRRLDEIIAQDAAAEDGGS
jgi:hypothetical protein